MSQIKVSELRADAAWLLIGSALAAIGQWIILMLLTRWSGLTVGGSYALALGIAAPIYLIAHLGTRLLLSLDVQRVLELGTLFSIRIYLVAVPLLGSALLLFVGDEAWIRVLVLVFLIKSIDGVSDFFYGAAQRARCAYRQGISLSLKSIGGIFAFSVGHRLAGYVGALTALAAINMLVAILYDALGSPDRERIVLHFPSAELWSTFGWLFVKSLPLIAGSVLVALAANLPRYILASNEQTESVAIFAALTSFVLALNVMATALGQALLSRYAHAFQKKATSEVWRWLTLSCGLVACGLIVGASVALIYGEDILRLTFGEAIAEHEAIFFPVILFAGIGVFAQTVSYANMATRRFWTIAFINLIGLIAAGIAAPSLIGHFAVLGAAMTMGLLGAIQLVGFLINLSNSLLELKNLKAVDP